MASFAARAIDDGTPAGYPNSDADHSLTVVRYDLRNGKPLATLVNFSLHPEMLNGNDLISADYLGPLQRMVDKRTKATTIYTQNAVGTGDADFVAIARAILYNPRWPWHAAAHFGATVKAPSQYLRSQPARYRDLFNTAE